MSKVNLRSLPAYRAVSLRCFVGLSFSTTLVQKLIPECVLGTYLVLQRAELAHDLDLESRWVPKADYKTVDSRFNAQGVQLGDSAMNLLSSSVQEK